MKVTRKLPKSSEEVSIFASYIRVGCSNTAKRIQVLKGVRNTLRQFTFIVRGDQRETAEVGATPERGTCSWAPIKLSD